jgi:protease IV
MPLDADALLDRRRLKRHLAAWRLIGIVALVGLGLLALGKATGLGQKSHIARLSVAGVITEDQHREAALEKLIKDDRVKALIVQINSPGGTTAGSEALYLQLRRAADRKPVVATIGTLGASGGYIVALAADRVFARESSLTGSIGVLMQTAEVSGLLEKLGVTSEVLTTGRLKGEPSMTKPLSPEGRAALGELLQDSHRWFVGLVQTRRDLAQEEAERLADGRVYTGRQAVANRLIDAIGGEREARVWLAKERGVPESLSVKDVKIDRDDDSWLGSSASAALSSFGKSLLSERLTLDGLMALWHPPAN